MATRDPESPAELIPRLTRRHLLAGWIGLTIFLTLGIVLESLHGLKLPFYLDARNSTRRLMWTLAHTHGTLFSAINILFALCLSRVTVTGVGAGEPAKRLRFASGNLLGALGLMPLGFFLGGLTLYGGDPGAGIFLVPLGAAMLLLGVGLFVRELIRAPDRSTDDKAVQPGEPRPTDASAGAKPAPRNKRKP